MSQSSEPTVQNLETQSNPEREETSTELELVSPPSPVQLRLFEPDDDPLDGVPEDESSDRPTGE